MGPVSVVGAARGDRLPIDHTGAATRDSLAGAEPRSGDEAGAMDRRRHQRFNRDNDQSQRLLEVRDLSTRFYTQRGVVHAADGVSFDLGHGETLGIVGESGSGKSVTALSIMRLIPDPPGRIVSGKVMFDGMNIMELSKEEMRRLRGHKIGMIFQDPMTSLNPTHTIGSQINESIRIHLGLSRRAAQDRTVELLEKVGIPHPRSRLHDYPHQFSGGMRQRVMIAIALACDPMLLLADEPTTALDVTIQAQILELIMSLSDELGTAVILITHDLGIAAGMCDRISVMYAGRIVETGPVDDIFENARMPYTSGLLASLPRLDIETGSRLHTIEGLPPDLIDPGPECRFSVRCRYVRDICRVSEPELTIRSAGGHRARCWGTEPGGWVQ